MKINTIPQTFIIFFSIGSFSLSTIDTVAQTSARPVFVAVPDTTRHGNATAAFAVQILPDEARHKFVLQINNPFGERLRISVSSEAEGTGFSEQTKRLQYRRVFSLTDAPDGRYTVHVTGGEIDFHKTITLETVTTINRGLNIQ